MKKNLIETIGFYHNGKHYMIKVFQVGFKYTVKSYLNNKEANSYTYSVRVGEVEMKDWKFQHGNKSPFIHMVEIAMDDIKNGFGIKPSS